MNLASQHRIGAIVVGLCFPGMTACAWPQTAPDPADRPAAPTVATLTIPSSQFVFVEHVGPYWTIGRRAAQARAYMDSRGIPGPVFVRYPQPPRHRTARDTRCEIGFVIDTPHVPDPPFQLTRRPEETVATLTIVGRPPDAEHDYANLSRWIEEHGHTAAGPITELYYPAGPLRGSTEAKVEIRLTLTRPVERAGTAPVAVTNTALGVTAATAQPKPASREPDVVAPTDVPVESVRVVSPAPPAPSEVELLDEQTPPCAEDDVAPESDSTTATGSEPTVQVERPRLSPAQPPIPPTEKVVPGQENSTAPIPDAPGSAPIADLLAEGRFGTVAEAILPAALPPTPGNRAWLHQVVLRIQATARGVSRLDTVDASTADSLIALADAIEARYKALGPGSVAGIPFPSTAPPDPGTERGAAAKRAITDALDALIGKVAARGIVPSEARDELYRALANLKELRPIIELQEPAAEQR